MPEINRCQRPIVSNIGDIKKAVFIKVWLIGIRLDLKNKSNLTPNNPKSNLTPLAEKEKQDGKEAKV